MSKSTLPSEFPCEIIIDTSTGKKTIELLSSLGGGGYNNAYLARDKSAQIENFVFKIYISDKQTSNLEAQILGTLRSQSIDLPIVKVLDSRVSFDNFRGHIESLAKGKKLQEQQPSLRQSLLLAMRFAKLLKSCAEAGIAYRDIKPGDHIFWEPGNDDNAVESMTVIDWNISQYPAKVDALYFDLVKFCNSLPEFFMGKPPKDAEYYHPLAWHFNEKLQERITPKLRIMLSDLWMNFVLPVFPEGENLLSITSLSPETIVKAWDKVIEKLNNGLEFLDRDRFPNLGYDNMAGYQAYLQGTANTDDIEKWTNDLIYNWVGAGEIQNPAILAPSSDAEEWIRLRLARLIKPGSFREALLLSVFVAMYRAGINKDLEAQPICQKLLQGLVGQKPPSSFYIKEDFQVLASLAGKRARQNGWLDIEKNHSAVWETLSKEFETWIACEKFESTADVDAMGDSIRKLDLFHPVVSFYNQRLKHAKSILQLKDDVETQLNRYCFDSARMLAKDLQDIDSDTAVYYETLIGLCERIHDIFSNDQNNPDAISQLMQDVGNWKLPSTFENQIGSLQERLPALNELKAFQSETDRADNLETLNGLYPKFDEFKKYGIEKYPSLASLKTSWQEKFNVILEKTFRQYTEEMKDFTGCRRIEILKKLLAKLEAALGFCRAYKEDALLAEIEKKRDNVKSEIESVNQNVKAKTDKCWEDYENLFKSALEEPMAKRFKKIDDLLSRVESENDFFDEEFNNWRRAEQKKVRIFLRAAEILETYKQSRVEEDEIGTIYDDLKPYSDDGKKLREEIEKFRKDQDLRYKILNEVQEIKDSQQKTSDTLETHRSKLDDLESELKATRSYVDEANLNIKNLGSADKAIVALSEQVKKFDSSIKKIYILSICSIVAVICMSASFLVATKVNGFNPMTVSPATSTSVPIANTAAAPTQIPTVMPTSIPPTNSPVAIDTPQPQEKALKGSAMFFSDAAGTNQVWSFTGADGVKLMVAVLEKGNNYSRVRVKVFIYKDHFSTDSLVKQNVSIWGVNSKNVMTQIGTSLNSFSIQKDGEPITGGFQGGFFEGWVQNEFLQ